MHLWIYFNMELVTPKKTDFYFLPLGGSGEIGMNLNLYGHDGQWLIVDCGITFGDIDHPSVDIVLPDISSIEKHTDKISGLILTHAHEDHIGAVHYLWPYLKCPIYATKFAAEVLKFKFRENDIDINDDELEINIIETDTIFSVGVFDIEVINMTHSILEPTGLLISTKVGTLFHTGDWKIDFNPQIGKAIDKKRLKELEKKNILAMVCDSTNIFVKGNSGSEEEVIDKLREEIRESKNRVFVTTFASNIMRLKTIVSIGHSLGRKIAFAGRSMHRMLEIANNCGYHSDLPPLIKEKDINKVAKKDILIICTGSQGEPRGALNRIANGDHQKISLNKGDKVIFSSRVIPGNEKYISRLQNKISDKGAEIVLSSQDIKIHVSGHPARDELEQMYNWGKPNALIAVHGETRHLNAHAEFAKQHQIKNAIPAKNGSMFAITDKLIKLIGEVESGRLVIDGNYIINRNSEVLKTRHKMMYNGVINIVLFLNKENMFLSKPSIFVDGVVDKNIDENPEEFLMEIIMSQVREIEKIDSTNKSKITEELVSELKRKIKSKFLKKPLINLKIEVIEKKRAYV